MNAPAAAVATEAQRIEDALAALLVAIQWADRQPPSVPDRGPISAGVLVMDMLDRMEGWTRAQQAADDLLRRPAAEALRQAVSTLGVRLHEIGGDTMMLDVCQRVCMLDPARESYRAGIIDHRWDGIGGWVA